MFLVEKIERGVENMLKYLKQHLRDNKGDANVSKMTLIAIVFVVGAILLIMMTSAFRGPIKDWWQSRAADWFKSENGAFAYEIDPFEAYERNENGTYKGLRYRCHMQGDDYWYIAFPASLQHGQNAADVDLEMEIFGNLILGYAGYEDTVYISEDGKTITIGEEVYEAYIPNK